MKVSDSQIHSRFLTSLLLGLLLVISTATAHAQEQPAQTPDMRQMEKKLEQLEQAPKGFGGFLDIEHRPRRYS
jgi:hypothetical protein